MALREVTRCYVGVAKSQPCEKVRNLNFSGPGCRDGMLPDHAQHRKSGAQFLHSHIGFLSKLNVASPRVSEASDGGIQVITFRLVNYHDIQS
jgi:hypothetical protein